MPPKKKDSKKSLKRAPSEDPSQSIETTILPIEKHSIPKKPMYKAIRCSTETRARLIQVKLWKAHYLYLADPRHDQPAIDPNDCDIKGNIYNTMSSKTSKKAFKNVRNLSLDKNINYIALKRFLKHKFKLERLRIGFPVGSPVLNMLKSSIYLGLKCLVLKDSPYFNRHYQRDTWEDLLDFLSCFKFIEYLSLWPLLQNSIPYSTIPKLKKLKRLEWQQDSQLQLLDPRISRHLSNLQDLSLHTPTFLDDHAVYSSLIPFDKIRSLSLNLNAQYLYQNLNILNFMMLSKFLSLESFSLVFSGAHHLVINDLSFLYNLKKLSLHKPAISSLTFTSLETLGTLPKLESLEISSSDDGILDVNFFKTLLSQTPNLKALSIFLPAHTFSQLLDEDCFDFPLLEKLSIRTHKIMIPFNGFAKNLSSFIKRSLNLKGLNLYFSESYHDFLEPIMKSVKSLGRLEELGLRLGKPIELQDRKIPLLKDVISKLECLKSVKLELPEHSFDSREVSGFATAFMKHEGLERLTLHVQFTKVSDESLKKFVELIRNAKKIKLLKLCIKGCPEEKGRELEKALGYDISYWDYSGTKISWSNSFSSSYY